MLGIILAYTGNVSPGTYEAVVETGTTPSSPSPSQFATGCVTYKIGASVTYGAANPLSVSVSTTVVEGWELSDLFYNGALAPDSASPASVTCTPGNSSDSQIFDVFSQSNCSDSFKIRVNCTQFSASGSWDVEIVGVDPATNSEIGILASGSVTAVGSTVEATKNSVSANAQVKFKIRVTPPSGAADEDYITLEVGVSTTKNGQAGYTPFTSADTWPADSKYDESLYAHSADGDTYPDADGDGQREEDYTNFGYVKFTVHCPWIIVDKSVSQTTVTPKTQISYTIRYDNDGGQPAQSVTIIEQIKSSPGGIAKYITDSAEDAAQNLPPTNEAYQVAYYFGTSWGSFYDLGSNPDDNNPSNDIMGIKWKVVAGAGGDGFVDANNGDTRGTVDGSIPDVDAGQVWYKIEIQ